MLGAARGLVMHLGADFIFKLLEIFVRSVLVFGDNYLKHFRCYIATQPGEQSCPILCAWCEKAVETSVDPKASGLLVP